MGLFSFIFGGDPGAELDKAAGYLEKGDLVRALEVARKIEKQRHPAHMMRARELASRAQDALVSQCIERSLSAEQEGDLEDAADWLRAALERVKDPTQRADLESRLRHLLDRLDDVRAGVRSDLRAAVRRMEGRDEEDLAPTRLFGAGGEGPQIEEDEYVWNLEAHYLTLIDTLKPEVAKRYEGRPEAFQRAYVALNEGQLQEARRQLDTLVAESAGTDAVLRFERGKARLATGDAAGAREDFEAAWTVLGDDLLDSADSLSVPSLWAEATLETGDPGTVADRLEEVAVLRAEAMDLRAFELRGRALLALERHDEARRLLAPAAARYPQAGALSYLLAQSLIASGEPRLAIHCLETALAPSCSGGRCSGPPPHVPSLQALAMLYLEQDHKVDRVRELLAFSAQAQGGRWGEGDFRILARYHQARGDEQAAREAREEAQRLARKGDDATASVEQQPDLIDQEAVL